VEQFGGLAWMTQPSVSPPSGDLRGVSANADDDVWAVGTIDNGILVIDHWDGFLWIPVTADTTCCRLEGVVALSSSDAWAVGMGYANTHNPVLRWDGRCWTTQTSRAGEGGSGFQGVGATCSADAVAA